MLDNAPARLSEARLLDYAPLPSARACRLVFNDDHGRRCAVVAVLALPDGPGPFPLVIHAPGGGQTIDPRDLAFWTDRGYACASFDWQHGLYDHDPAYKSCWPAGVVEQGHDHLWVSQAILPHACLLYTSDAADDM
jgi:hypothetical protein